MTESKQTDTILTPTERGQLKGMANYWREVFGRDNQEVLYQECQQAYSLLGHRMLSIIMFYLKETVEVDTPNTQTK